MARMIGAEMFFETLIEEGIDVIFGLPGGYVLKVYDVMPKFEGKIKHVLARHEQGATHMADGYARASGKPGVVLCTSGPAATNTVTGIATAQMDSSPIVVFTGQVPLVPSQALCLCRPLRILARALEYRKMLQCRQGSFYPLTLRIAFRPFLTLWY